MVGNRWPESLPVYRLGPPPLDDLVVYRRSRELLKLDDFETSIDDGWLRSSAAGKSVEVHPTGGGVWIADRSRLWRLSDGKRALDPGRALERAKAVVAESELLPDIREPFSLVELEPGRALAARMDGERRDPRPELVHVSARWGVEVRVPGLDAPVPVVGGGAKFVATAAADDELASFQGAWRPIVGEFEVKTLSADGVDEQFKELTQHLAIESVESRLVYHAAPGSRAQEYLYPAREYRATARYGERLVPLRVILLPATEFGPDLPTAIDQLERSPKVRAAAVSLGGLKRGLMTLSARAFVPFEAGTSWIGLSGGLGGSQGNVQGFVDGLANDGWRINFNWGDGNAWESDWRRNDDDWVDAADFVFYTGHADMNGWVLASPDDGALDFTEVAGRSDLYGQQDLEWVVIAACGPLQDDVISPGGGDVFTRWSPSFDGLHLFLGYGAITFDNSDEGRLLVQYARRGERLVDAWFRTATEVQPSTNGASAPDGPDIWVGAVWPYKAGVPAVENDHLWGHGSVSPDIRGADGFVAMWTTT